jgi:hypothetical protein
LPAAGLVADELDDPLELEPFELVEPEEAPDPRPGATSAFGGGVPIGGGAFGFSWRSHVWNAVGVTTCTVARINEWPAPHSSVHSAGYVPSRSGVTRSVVTIPGTASSF